MRPYTLVVANGGYAYLLDGLQNQIWTTDDTVHQFPTYAVLPTQFPTKSPATPLPTEAPTSISITSTNPCCQCLSQSYDPGCTQDSVCEANICAVDEYCCSNVWDFVCTSLANNVCNAGTLHPTPEPTVSPTFDACTFRNDAIVIIAMNRVIGQVEIGSVMEITFDLQINQPLSCYAQYCHIFAIGNRLPLIYTSPSGQLTTSIKILSGSAHVQHVVNGAYSVITDGDWHSVYLRYTSTSSVVKIDDIVYLQEYTVLDFSSSVGQSKYVETVWGSSVQLVHDGSLRNICITSSDTEVPSPIPSKAPTESMNYPTIQPTGVPTKNPSSYPTLEPTAYPSSFPTDIPSESPSFHPTMEPTLNPSAFPSIIPSISPSYRPSLNPTTSRPTK